MKKNVFVYFIIVGIFASLIWFILEQGKTLQSGNSYISKVKISDSKTKDTISSEKEVKTIFDPFIQNIKHPLSVLFIQIIFILLLSRLFGLLANKIGQPSVTGEIIAGIFLGPSLVGTLFPEFSAFLFPVQSLQTLQFFSQVGLVFFMFIIGMELDLTKVKKKAHDALVISHASIVFPYFLGIGLAYFIYEQFAPANISFLSFSLFMGIAMSITAFPVLARIIQERGLSKTALGSLAITCAAADDITAWCLLPAVIAIVKAENLNGIMATVAFSIGYVLFMFYVIKPIIARVSQKYGSKEKTDKTIIAISFVILLGSSYISEVIGIHALFGAFIAGVIMPTDFSFKNTLTEKIEDVSLLLLLPIFFVFTGLRTQIGLLNDPALWLLCVVVIMTAIAGKLGGSAISAK
ncbi:MAG TPA: cation:proton antiporter, partial [Cytophagaceae bacterium]|nr:cation:proton antiporter [Cytophagaceae bacterium]